MNDFTGRVVVVTGASTGIGLAAATAFARGHARVALVARDSARLEQALSAVRESAAAGADAVTAFPADFTRFDDVRSLATALGRAYPRIDVLANNAGGAYAKRATTADGLEQTIQTNHLSPFLLTNLLLPRLIENAADASVRVVSTASMANLFGRLRLDDVDWQKRAWLGGWRAYGSAKLANILFIRELAERATGTGIEAFSFHPGTVVTSFGATSPLIRFGNLVTGGRYGISAERGAMPLVALAGPAPVGAPSGTYFDRMTPNGKVSARARDPQLARDLWALSARLVGLPPAPAA